MCSVVLVFLPAHNYRATSWKLANPPTLMGQPGEDIIGGQDESCTHQRSGLLGQVALKGGDEGHCCWLSNVFCVSWDFEVRAEMDRRGADVFFLSGRGASLLGARSLVEEEEGISKSRETGDDATPI